MNEIPYFGTKKDNYCGPAVIQMVAAYFGISIAQRKLARMLDVKKPEDYTRKKALRDTLDELGLKYKEFAYEAAHGKYEKIEKNSLEKLLEQIDTGDPVIVNIRGKHPTKVGYKGHYIIAHNYDKENIRVHDPDLGPNIKMKKSEFLTRWISGNEKWVNWFMVVSKNNSNI